MLKRVLPLCLAMVAALVFCTAVVADAKDKDKDSTRDGKVVKAADGKLEITDSNGKDVSLTVAKDAKITCDGKECKLEDLKKDTAVTVTVTKDGDKEQVVKIDAKSK